MASDRLLKALDMLAGVAGQEVNNARQFQLEQNQRMEALQRLTQQEQQEAQFRQAELNYRKAALQQAAEQHRDTEGRLTTQFDKTDKRLTKQAEMDLQIREALNKTNLEIARIRSADELIKVNAQRVLMAEQSLNEAVQSGLDDQELIPYYEKLRQTETLAYGRAITPLPTIEEELPPPPDLGEPQQDSGPGFFSKALDFLTNNAVLNEDEFLGIPFNKESAQRVEERKRKKKVLSELSQSIKPEVSHR